MLLTQVNFLLVAALGLTSACAPTPLEELTIAPLPAADSVSGALAATPDSFFYLVSRPDLRRCAYPLCGGAFIQRVNLGNAVCADGTTQKECRILEFDYAALQLDSAARDQLAAQAAKGQVLLRGTIRKTALIAGHAYDQLAVAQAYTLVPASSPGTGKLGAACGSRGLPWECDAGLFCKRLPAANCGRSDAPGTCSVQPTICYDLYKPVCGCDGVTYGNECKAGAAGTSVDYDGPCA